MKNKRFGLEEYEVLHKEVLLFKETKDPEVSAVILDKFHIFVEKIVYLVCYGHLNVMDKVSINLLKLYTTPVDMSKAKHETYLRIHSPSNLKKAQESKEVKKEVIIKAREDARANAMNKIKALFSSLSEDDIRQIAHVTLLHMAMLYKDTKPSFHTYVLRTFHFNFYRQVDKYIRDPLARDFVQHSVTDTFDTECRSSLQDFAEAEERVDRERASVYKDTVTKQNTSHFEDDFLDINWLEGYTCDSIFKALTTFERRILYLKSVKKMTDKEIGDMFGYYKGTIFKKRKKAKLKLIEAMKNR